MKAALGLSIKAHLRRQRHIRQAQSLAEMPLSSICNFLGSPRKFFFDKPRFFVSDFLKNTENLPVILKISREIILLQGQKSLKKTNVFREAEFPLDRKGMDIKMANNKNKKNAALNSIKMQAANEVGVPLKEGYNGDLTAKQVGSVGGQMVKKMIESYENSAQ